MKEKINTEKISVEDLKMAKNGDRNTWAKLFKEGKSREEIVKQVVENMVKNTGR